MQCNDWSSKYLNMYSQWCLRSCEISLIKIIFFCKYAQDLREFCCKKDNSKSDLSKESNFC